MLGLSELFVGGATELLVADCNQRRSRCRRTLVLVVATQRCSETGLVNVTAVFADAVLESGHSHAVSRPRIFLDLHRSAADEALLDGSVHWSSPSLEAIEAVATAE